MTEYGQGPQPWHPEDPLYGDRGWQGQEATAGQYGYDSGQYPQYDQEYPGYGYYGADQGYYSQEGYLGYSDPGYPAQQPYGADPGAGQGGYYGTPSYDGYPQQLAEHPDGYYDPQVGHPPPAPYPPSGPRIPQQTSYPRSDPGQPYPGQPGHDQGGDPWSPEPEQLDDWRAEPAEPARWATEGPVEDHPFFADDPADEAPTTGGRRRGPPDRRDDEPYGEPDEGHPEDDEEYGPDDDPPAAPSGRRRGRKEGRRSGPACLVVTVVLTGVVGGVGYFGYQFWQDHFGPPPDYDGNGSGKVQVKVPDDAGGAQIGNILREAGVVKSTDAFVEAVNNSSKGGSIQPGTYTLHRHMSANAAVDMLTDPATLNALVVYEGMRNSQVYAAVDKKIGLEPGTTEEVASEEADHLGLPSWAKEHARQEKVKDPLEGFLYPSRYSVGKDSKPKDVLRHMVARASKEYQKYDLAGEASKLGLKSPWQVVTVASLVQAEGVTHDDFRKMAEVVYNRLKPGNTETNGLLEFDSTYNYAKDQSKIDLSIAELRQTDHPYNTYYHKGLPPGPIGNPGGTALKASTAPDDGGWYYFISMDGKTSKFTKTYAEHKKLVDEFNRNNRQGGDSE